MKGIMPLTAAPGDNEFLDTVEDFIAENSPHRNHLRLSP